jgi:hypothetical protein
LFFYRSLFAIFLSIYSWKRSAEYADYRAFPNIKRQPKERETPSDTAGKHIDPVTEKRKIARLHDPISHRNLPMGNEMTFSE